MIVKVVLSGLGALALATAQSGGGCGGNVVVTTGTSSGGGTTSGGNSGGTTSGGTTGGVNPNPSGGFACPVDTEHPTPRYYPGGPYNTNLGYHKGQVFPDIALGGGYWNLTTPNPVYDYGTGGTATNPTQVFYNNQLSFHDLFCSGKFKVALVDISAGWCGPCNNEGQDLPHYGAPVWLPEGGIIFSILAEGAIEGSHHAEKSDLDIWITKHGTNYPLVLSPDSLVASIIDLPSWPTNIFINLRNMVVLGTFQGYLPCNGSTCSDEAYADMTKWLNAGQ
jgi:hypothetical protein